MKIQSRVIYQIRAMPACDAHGLGSKILACIDDRMRGARVTHSLRFFLAGHRTDDGFAFWGDIRGVLQSLAFVANLWAMTVVLTLGGAGPMVSSHAERKA
jgi:hypothetical protein